MGKSYIGCRFYDRSNQTYKDGSRTQVVAYAKQNKFSLLIFRISQTVLEKIFFNIDHVRLVH